MGMSSSRPYMIRALYEWIVDNNCTPYLLVDAHVLGVEVPQQHVNDDGQIILNIAPSAVSGLSLDGAQVTFSARFGGVPTNIYVPCSGVLGIYTRENGQGMIFEVEPGRDPEPPKPDLKKTSNSPKVDSIKSGAKRPGLKVVK